MKNKYFISIISVVLLAAGQSMAAPSYNYDEENKVLTISGTGSAGNGGYTSATSVVIEDGVTSLQGQAFRGTALENVTFAKDGTLTSIGERAFESTKITSIDIPDTVTSIGINAFQYSKLTSLTIPDSVTSGNIGCNSCSQLTEVTIGKGVTSLQGQAFKGTALENVTFAKDGTLTSIGERAFEGTNITSIDIPNTVTSIGWDAFKYCSKLTSLNIPDGATIGGGAFNGVKLGNLTISAAQLENYLKAGGGFLANPDLVKIKCTSGNCKEILETYGNGKYAAYGAGVRYGSVKNADGSTTYFDDDGNVAYYTGKRIYTIEEANAVTKPAGNTFKLRYK
ncbi:MAG: leucine-rich repeat protein [Alphaproteobacteria bacterium]|nr:leucine-rich repeat protein [Alphaproteobacteria bacterium]